MTLCNSNTKFFSLLKRMHNRLVQHLNYIMDIKIFRFGNILNSCNFVLPCRCSLSPVSGTDIQSDSWVRKVLSKSKSSFRRFKQAGSYHAPAQESGHAVPLCCGVIMGYEKEFSPQHYLPQHPICLAVSDGSLKTATGTICIEVPDVNDYCPVIVAERETICIASPSILISAAGVNSHPYGSPFTFCVVNEPPGTADIWDITSVNGK